METDWNASQPLSWETLIAGGVAGLVSDTLFHPLDTISLRAKVHPTSAFGTFVGAFGLIFKQEGWRGYYAGVRATMMTSPISNAVYFTVYEQLKRAFQRGFGPGYEPLSYFLAGGLSEVASSLLVLPMEIAKARLQLGANPNRATGGMLPHSVNFRGVSHALRGIYIERGLVGLTAGWRACLTLDVAYSATQFLFYEQIKATGRRHYQRPLTTPETLLAGSVAGAVAALATNPIDVIASRMMVQGDSAGYGGGSALKVLRTAMAESPVALWRGALPRIAQLAPMSAVNFFVYEAVRKVLHERNIGASSSAIATAGGAGGGAAHAPFNRVAAAATADTSLR